MHLLHVCFIEQTGYYAKKRFMIHQVEAAVNDSTFTKYFGLC